MHAVSALEQRSQGRIWEVVLHFKQMDQLWHHSALFDYFLQVLVGLCDKLFDGLKVSEDTVLVFVLENSEVRLARHQETLFNDVDQTEAQEIEGNVHEVGRGAWHEAKNAVTNLGTVGMLGHSVLGGALNSCFFGVECLAFANQTF